MDRTQTEARLRGLERTLNDLLARLDRAESGLADARSKLLQGAGGGQQVGFRPGESRHGVVGVGGIDAAADDDHMGTGPGLLREGVGSGEVADTDVEVDFWNKSVDDGVDAGNQVVVTYIDGEWVVTLDLGACP